MRPIPAGAVWAVVVVVAATALVGSGLLLGRWLGGLPSGTGQVIAIVPVSPPGSATERTRGAAATRALPTPVGGATVAPAARPTVEVGPAPTCQVFCLDSCVGCTPP